MENYSPSPGSPGALGPGGTAQASGASASSKDGGIQRADGTPVRVLVVDDEPSLAELLASVLRYEGWTVRTAGNGADAVRTVQPSYRSTLARSSARLGDRKSVCRERV